MTILSYKDILELVKESEQLLIKEFINDLLNINTRRIIIEKYKEKLIKDDKKT